MENKSSNTVLSEERPVSHKYAFQLVPVGNINVNRLYQRDAENRVVKSIITSFDYHLVNPIKVVFRDGEFWAFDGQNTAIGLQMLFGPEYLAPCLVYFDIPTWCDEAILFEKTNDPKAKKPVSTAQAWKSKLARGEDTTSDIKRVCERYGLGIPTGKQKDATGKVYALSALERVHADLTPEQFETVIEVISSAWHGEKTSLTSPVIVGVGRFVKAYWGEFNKRSLINRLSRRSAGEVVRAGRALLTSGSAKYARAILDVYNLGTTTNRLNETKL